ncbi:MAG: OmpP1/FadL family transporter [Desulfosoma sp.]
MKGKRWCAAFLGLGALLLMVASQAGAAGFALYEGSARGNALGGNLTGSADDVSALFFNPAGITQLPGVQVMAGATFIAPMTDVTTVNPYSGQSNTKSAESNVWIPPHLYASYQFSDALWFGAGLYSRFGLGTEFDKNWWGRYNNYNAVIQTLSFNPNVAVKLNDMVSVAAGVEVMWFDLTLEQKIDATAPFVRGGAGSTLAALGYSTRINDPTTSALDVKSKLTGDTFGYGFTLGLHVKPADWLSLGASYHSNVKQHIDGDADFTKPAALTSGPLAAATATWFNDTGAEGSVMLPDMLFLGAGIRPMDRLLIELGAIWTGWSSYKDLTIKYDEAILPGVTSVTKAKNWMDVWRLSIGAEYKVTDWFDLRASYIFDESPIPDSTVDYLVPANDRHMFGIGTGFHWNAWTLDLSYTYLMIEERTVEPRLADGVYQSKFENGDAHLIGISASYKF